MAPPDFALESCLMAQGRGLIAGVDEAGRGPLAGPVAAAAVILDPGGLPEGLDDSKKLTPERREKAFDDILACARAIAIVYVPHDVIDRLNIRAASLLAMRRALAALALRPDHALIDGRDIPDGCPCAATAVIGGDSRSLSVAAASIVAKVCRDRLMLAAAPAFPHWDFAAHKGYPTKAHRAAIASHGASALHRLSFAPFRDRAGGGQKR